MRLTKEEKEALTREILNDLPEGYSLFPPWLWLALTVILLLMWGGAGLAMTLTDLFLLEPGVTFGLGVFITIFGVCAPNVLIVVAGKNILGIRYIRAVAIVYIFLSLPDLFLEWPKPITCTVTVLFALLILRITYTLRFQAFALHQKRMADWRREREKKNKIFREKIKRNRQLSGEK